jgi:CO/xanthine dehydrogenase FAD-binding subunit
MRPSAISLQREPTMRPAPFRYFAPHSVEAVKALLAEHGDDARLLAGGQSLLPLMNLRLARPGVIVDLNRVGGLNAIERRESELVFGPMVRQYDAEQSALVASDCPLIGRALSLAGPLAVRQRATVGGTLAHADRTAELPGVATALDATFVVDGPSGRRELKPADFFRSDLATAIDAGEMLAEVRFPVRPHDEFAQFFEAGTRRRDMAVAGLAIVLDCEGNRCHEARIAVVGVAPTPLRLTEVEAVLVADGLAAPTIREAADHAAAEIEMVADVHASVAFRRHLVAALIGKAVAAARRSLQ